MRTLRAHIKLSIFENIFLRIEKVMTTFSIFEKIFLNIESLRAHINRTLHSFILYFFNLTASKFKAVWTKILE